MHLICERGTATMNLAEAQFLYELTDGQVCVGYTSMEGQFVLAWDEAKSGCSNGKGLIESWHNLFHNEQASLPGQTGKDRNHTPTALLGSDREVAALNKVAMVLTPQQRARLAMPYPSITQAHRETLRIVQNINHRRDADRSVTGDLGYTASAELYTPDFGDVIAPNDVEAKALVFADYGRVSDHDASTPNLTLASLGVGLRLSFMKNLLFRIDAGQALKPLTGTVPGMARRRGDTFVHASAIYSY